MNKSTIFLVIAFTVLCLASHSYDKHFTVLEKEAHAIVQNFAKIEQPWHNMYASTAYLENEQQHVSRPIMGIARLLSRPIGHMWSICNIPCILERTYTLECIEEKQSEICEYPFYDRSGNKTSVTGILLCFIGKNYVNIYIALFRESLEKGKLIDLIPSHTNIPDVTKIVEMYKAIVQWVFRNYKFGTPYQVDEDIDSMDDESIIAFPFPFEIPDIDMKYTNFQYAVIKFP